MMLVTGGSGLLGSYLKRLYNLHQPIFISSKDFDLTKERDVAAMFTHYQPKIVVHLAAKVGGIMENINNPVAFFEDNVLMNTLLLKYSQQFRVKKFVAVLSSCIYPDIAEYYPLKEDKLHESKPTETNLGYGYSKRMLGVHIDILKKLGYNYSYIIPSNLYGIFERGGLTQKHFVGALLDKIILAKKTNATNIELLGDGTPLRQFTYAEDVAKILKWYIECDIKDNLNISNEENLSINEIAKLALKISNMEHLSITYDRSKPNGQFRKDIDISKFRALNPEFKFTPLKDGLKLTYDYLNQ